MNKTRTVGLCLIIIILGTAWVVFGQDQVEEIRVPMGIIPLEPPEEIEAKRAPVDFPHARHFVNDCKTCHHEWEYDSEILLCRAAECHDVFQSPKKETNTDSEDVLEILYYKKAYHQLCIGCHKDITLQNIEEEMKLRLDDKETQISKVGPLTCIKCHPKE